MERNAHLTTIVILSIFYVISPVVSHPEDEAPYRGRRVHVVFDDADIKDVLFFIGDAMGMNVVIDGDVSGRITLTLKDIPWDQALGLVLFRAGLEAAFEDGFLFVWKTP